MIVLPTKRKPIPVLNPFAGCYPKWPVLPKEYSMADEPKKPEEEPKKVEKEKPLDQKTREVDKPPGGPATVVVPPG